MISPRVARIYAVLSFLLLATYLVGSCLECHKATALSARAVCWALMSLIAGAAFIQGGKLLKHLEAARKGKEPVDSAAIRWPAISSARWFALLGLGIVWTVGALSSSDTFLARNFVVAAGLVLVVCEFFPKSVTKIRHAVESNRNGAAKWLLAISVASGGLVIATLIASRDLMVENPVLAVLCAVLGLVNIASQMYVAGYEDRYINGHPFNSERGDRRRRGRGLGRRGRE